MANCSTVPTCSTINDPCKRGVTNAKCVVYTGVNLSCLGVTTNERLDSILTKIDGLLCESGVNLTFNNWLTSSGGLVQFGGTLVHDTEIDFNSYELLVTNARQNNGAPFLFGQDSNGNFVKVDATTFVTDIPATTLPSTEALNGLYSTFDFPSRTYTVKMGVNPLVETTTITMDGYSLNFIQDVLSFANGVNITSDSTLASGNGSKLLNVTTTGINDTSAQTTYGGYFSNTHSGTTSRDIGVFGEAVGGTENFAGYFNYQIRLSDLTLPEAGYHVDLVGSNPASLNIASSSFVCTFNSLQQYVMSDSKVRWNAAGQDPSYEFRVSGDGNENVLMVGAGQGLATAYKVGINRDPDTTLDVKTKYYAIVPSTVFSIAKWTAAKYFTTGIIPDPTVGFGISHDFYIQNGVNTSVHSAATVYTTTSVTDTSESVDFTLQLINAGALGTKFTVKSTGAISTVQPSGNGAGLYRLGKVVAGAVALDTANYVEVEIDGVIVKLLKAS